MSSTKRLVPPERYPELFRLIEDGNPGGGNRERAKEMLTLAFMEEQAEATHRLVTATWALAGLTGALVLATAALVYVTVHLALK